MRKSALKCVLKRHSLVHGPPPRRGLERFALELEELEPLPRTLPRRSDPGL